jgi:class 3 adenylate cyclase/tetratricopeptide (TPR) repeat protein
MRQCPACGAENPVDHRFCGACGAPLDVLCPSCGGAARPGQRFCGQCGAALAEPSGSARPGSVPAAPTTPPGVSGAPISERRVCSVLFADLVGFTPLSEARDPEEVRDILSRYFEVARTLVARYGGVVEKFIGDAVMAVWGTPVAEEGDVERAVRAALELVDAIEALGAEVGAKGLSARAGVVTGEVAVTIGATGEGMVAGDAVNTASRVQSVARPGSVFVDDATKKLSERAILFEDAGSHQLKGKERPEHLCRAVRVLSGMGGNQRADGLEAPLTGRDVEIRALKDLFHACADRRTPRLVVVSGPAGVGKSRLGWEFEKYIDGLADTVLWHRGRCLSYGEGVAFWALAEIIRQRFGIAEEDSTEVASQKLKEGMVRFVQDETERDYVGVRLSRLLGVPYPTETRVVLSQEELFAGWRLFFERLAQVAPVVMFMEDGQHADESLLGFLEHLIDWTRDLPIFAVIFARPGLEAIDSGYGMGRNRSTVSLDPLDDASMDALVDALVPGVPTPARDTITARAQGIPLFAVETVRSLIDQGIVQPDADTYRLVGDLGELAIPDSLHALLAARLDALPQEVRSLVADACVLGTSFPKDALVAVSGKGEDVVEAGLAELVRRDVLRIFADPLSPERGAYRFGQEMLRQVAYETLSKRDRKSRHLAVATHLRATFANDAEEIADAVARHYLDALAAGPNDADAGDITEKALGFLVRAAERAGRSGAPLRAAESYAEAAAIAPAVQAAGLFEKASQASADYGDLEAAASLATAALDRHLEMGDVRGAARARSMKGGALQQSGRHTAARVELIGALEALRPDPDRDTVTALVRLAALEIFSGNIGEGRQLVTEALALGQALDVGDADLALCFNTQGLAASHANRAIEAAASYETAARLAERAGVYRTLATAQANLADVLPRSGDVRGAVDAARSAAAHARRTGGRDTLAYAVVNLAVPLLELGEWDEAHTALSTSMQVEHLDHELVHCFAGWLAGSRGDGARAASALESMPTRRLSEEPQMQADIGVLEALIAFAAGDPNDGLAHAVGVVEKGDAVGIGHESQRWAWPLAARAARSLGDHGTLSGLVATLDAHPVGHLPPVLRACRRLMTALAAADARTPDAAASVADAVGAFREVGNPYQLAHGLVDLAEVLARAGEGGVDGALAEAVAIADRLGCPPLRARAASVGSRYAGADASA